MFIFKNKKAYIIYLLFLFCLLNLYACNKDYSQYKDGWVDSNKYVKNHELVKNDWIYDRGPEYTNITDENDPNNFYKKYWYYFDGKGNKVSNKIFNIGEDSYAFSGGLKEKGYYGLGKGHMITGWIYLINDRAYIYASKTTGKIFKNTEITINGETFIFDKKGIARNNEGRIKERPAIDLD